ncbi:MAG: sensor histidine kinase [Minwuia sp.]|uniref:sensor histidine kinase n=1 Tax=Minwuia sp. TaxID=2493630 RepID=UPI003A87CB5C
MIDLDAKTILFVAFVANLSVSYFIQAQRRPPIAAAALAARLWSVGFGVIGIGAFLISLEDRVPNVLSIVIGETLGIGGFSIAILGTRAFMSLNVRIWPVIISMLLITSASVYFTLIQPDDRMRVLVLSIWGFLACWYLFISLRPWIPPSRIGNRTRRPAAVIVLVYSAAVAYYGVKVGFGPDFDDYLTDSGATTSTIAVLYLIAVVYGLWSMSLLSGRMSSELDKEIRKRDRLISVLAHDLRTPFNSLIGGTEALRMFVRKGEPERVERMADTVHTAATQALSLVESLLYWGRNQLSGATLEPVQLDQAIEAACAPLRESFREKDISLATECEPGITAVAEAGGLETILRNLLSNALKFSPGGEQVSISARRDGEEIIAVVRDCGIGMSQDVLRRIEDPANLFTAEGTLGETGTGLGLSFCRDLVASYQGRLEFDTTPGMGTTVRLRLPAGPTEAALKDDLDVAA